MTSPIASGLVVLRLTETIHSMLTWGSLTPGSNHWYNIWEDLSQTTSLMKGHAVNHSRLESNQVKRATLNSQLIKWKLSLLVTAPSLRSCIHDEQWRIIKQINSFIASTVVR